MTNYGCDLLVFAPHPDDAECFCGGTILRAVSRGQRVVVVDLTLGELSSRGNVATRSAETEAASQVLGLSARENLGLPDGQIGIDAVNHTEQVVRVLRRLRPELVLAPYWKDRHPDHRRASTLITDALFYSNVAQYMRDLQPFRPGAVWFYQLRFAFSPSVVVDITDSHARKLDAIRSYRTQLGLDADEGHRTLISSPLTVDAFIARDGYFGAMIGVRYGEPFLSRSPAGTGDLLDYSRHIVRGEPHFYPGER